MSLSLSELPKEIRVKLTETGQKELWNKIDELGGIKEFSENCDYSSSKLYNWKNKESYMPLEITLRVLGTEVRGQIKAYKGEGRSKPVRNPVIPLPQNNELLTRIDSSVHVSKTPVYQTGDKDVLDRFKNLLDLYGEVPFKVYRRSSVYELRYPLYFHRLLQKMSYQEDFAALVDEEGFIQNGYVRAGDRKETVYNFSGDLYSRDKMLKLALERGDEEKVKEITLEEVKKVKRLF